MEPSASQTHGFLFADLRGYTRFVEANGDEAAARLLQAYRLLVRGVVGQSRGAEIRTEGDSFFVVFPSASSAMQAGLAILASAAEHNRTSGPPIAVGIGVHAGETADTSEGHVGSAVNISARVCAQARAGELLVTETVRSLTRTLAPVRFESRGSPRLKGISEAIPLYAVVPMAEGGSEGTRVRAPGRRRFGGRTGALVGLIGAVVVSGSIVLGAVLLGATASPTRAPAGSPASTTAAGTSATIGPTTPSSPVPSPVASPAASPTAVATSPRPSAEAYPNSLETDLLARMPDTVTRGTCRRADPGEAATRAMASVHCDLDPAVADAQFAIYDRFDSQQAMRAYVTGLQTNQYRLVKGDCQTSTAAWQLWSFGAFEGTLLCYVDQAGHAWVTWSYDSSNITARATRPDRQSGKLYSWWVTTSALMVR